MPLSADIPPRPHLRNESNGGAGSIAGTKEKRAIVRSMALSGHVSCCSKEDGPSRAGSLDIYFRGVERGKHEMWRELLGGALIGMGALSICARVLARSADLRRFARRSLSDLTPKPHR